MEPQDPYAPPKSEINPIYSDNEIFSTLSNREIKTLYNRSRSLTTYGYLAVMGCTLAVLGLIFSLFGEDPIFGAIIFLVSAVLNGFTAKGFLARSEWGRYLGFVVFTIGLFAFPLGTLLSIYGFYLFIKTPELFGKSRLLHADIKREFMLRKGKPIKAS